MERQHTRPDGRVNYHRLGHRRADKRGYVFRYNLIAEDALGKPLPDSSIVHHADGDPSNDRNINLVLCEGVGYHKYLHIRMRSMAATGSPHNRKCTICKGYDDPGNMVVKGSSYRHRECFRLYQIKYRKKKSERV